MIWIAVLIGGKRLKSPHLRTLASAGVHRMLLRVLITKEAASGRRLASIARGYDLTGGQP
jgi:hypothetical protein